MTKAIVVFTYRSVQHILEMGGTEAWTCTLEGAKACEYVVITRNTNGVPPRDGHPGIAAEGDEPHRSAFMIGKISDVVLADDQPTNPGERARYRIEFAEWAPLNIPDVWQKNRLPFHYRTLEDIGIDPSKLDWKPVPPLPAWADPISAAFAGSGLTTLDTPLFGRDRSVAEIVSELKTAVARQNGTSPEKVKVSVTVETTREMAF